MRKLAEEGKLTSKVVGDALLRMQEDVDEKFGKTTATVGEAFTNLRTAAGIALTELAQEPGPASVFAKAAQGVLDLTNDVKALAETLKTVIGYAITFGTIWLSFKGITAANAAVSLLNGQMRQLAISATTFTNVFAKDMKSIKNGFVGIGAGLGTLDAKRGSVLRLTGELKGLSGIVARVAQVVNSLGTVFGAVLRIGLRFAGWIGIFMAVVDVINLLYQAVTGSNKKLIDFSKIFTGIITVVRVVYGLLSILGNYIGGVLSPYVSAMAGAWRNLMSAIMDSGPIKAAGAALDWIGSKLSGLWQTAKDISGVTAADDKARQEKYLMNPVGGLLPYGEQKKAPPPIALGAGKPKGGGGKSAKDIAKEQADALRDVKSAILEVTAAFSESSKARLEDLNFQMKSLGMSEDQIALESQLRDIIREQKTALDDLDAKQKDIQQNENLSKKGREEALALLAKQRTEVQATAAAELAASEATLQAIQATNIEREKANGLIELQNLAASNKVALQNMEEQLQLVGLYGDNLDEVTAQLETQQKLREIELKFQEELRKLDSERLAIGEARYANQLALIKAISAESVEAVKAQAGAQKKIDDLKKKSDRNDIGAAIGKRFEELERSVDPAVTAVEGLNSVFSNMGNALDTFVQTGKFKFGDFAKSIIADLAKIAAKAAITKLFTLIGKSILGPKAAGGPVMASKPYLVGEQGPELFVPNSAGSIMTNASMNKNAGAGSGMGATVNNTYITNNISAIDSRSVAQMFVENRKSLLGASMMARKETPYGG